MKTSVLLQPFSKKGRLGFTFIEVLTALLIAGVAITYLVASEIESAHRATEAQALRKALRLGKAKLNEIALGEERALSGNFEEPASWFWDAYLTTRPDSFNAEKLTLKVHYYVGTEEKELTLERLLP